MLIKFNVVDLHGLSLNFNGKDLAPNPS